MPFPALPKEIVAIFGPAAAEKFVDFLNSTLSLQREDVIAMSAARFENKLTGEIAGVRLEIADVRIEIANLRSEMKADFAAVHREISAQTKWILAGLGAAITLYPLITRLVAKLIP